MSNGVSNYSIIRVAPTLSTDAYAQGDVLFNPTAIPNAVRGDNGCSELVAMYLMDYSDNATSDIRFVFTESGGTNFGTINETANIADGDLKALGICGGGMLDADQGSTSSFIDTSRLYPVLSLPGSSDTYPFGFLQAASGSTSVYITGIFTSSGTPTYAADSFELIFHIKYK